MSLLRLHPPVEQLLDSWRHLRAAEFRTASRVKLQLKLTHPQLVLLLSDTLYSGLHVSLLFIRAGWKRSKHTETLTHHFLHML